MFGVGLALAITGGIADIGGAIMYGSATHSCMMFCDKAERSDTAGQTRGALIALGGTVMMAVGIPLAIAGGRRVTVSPSAGGGAVSVVF